MRLTRWDVGGFGGQSDLVYEEAALGYKSVKDWLRIIDEILQTQYGTTRCIDKGPVRIRDIVPLSNNSKKDSLCIGLVRDGSDVQHCVNGGLQRTRLAICIRWFVADNGHAKPDLLVEIHQEVTAAGVHGFDDG